MNLSQGGNGAANRKESGMSPFGKNYQWRNTMYSLWHYLVRRLLGAVAKVLDRMDRRERERQALLSDEAVERAARGIQASHDRGDWDEELPVVQDEYRDMARAALTAAMGEDEK